ncbi:C-type mannose receptor 2-like [Etheostoma cragini]|uniref:C-type mannose receptor 2-like n=1 Tax=Etheostoma cragini TaxID=417921 RepID=UPI00155F053B|nr:C-type mannose receptor 2-like [Etheostoma cragini]
MDQQMDVYVNEEGPFGYSGKRKSLAKSTENIYESLEPNRTRPALSGAEDVKKSSCRAAVVCLCVLCLLLLTGLITVVRLFTKGNSEWEMKMALLHNSCTNLTQERDQLQTRYTNLTEERDQLQTSYNNLNQERYQFQKRVEDMAKEITDLRKKLQDLSNKQEWMHFSGSFYHFSSKKKSWQGSRDDCVQKGADLVIINSREEQEFIGRFPKHLWIGLTDKETEGRWTWVDGTLLTQSYWMPSEPNGHMSRDEECAEISNSFFLNSWNDDLCNVEKFWICEMTLTLLSGELKECLHGMIERMKVLHLRADQSCELSRNISDRTVEAQKGIDTNRAQSVELLRVTTGLAEKVDGLQQSLRDTDARMTLRNMARFVHGEQSEITDYVNLPEPSARSVGQDGGATAAWSGGKLYRLVAVSFGLLCVLQVAVNISLHLYSFYSKTPDTAFNCTNLRSKLITFDRFSQQGWVYFRRSFYYFSTRQSSWQEGRADCLQRDADLVIINSKPEQDFTRQFNKVSWIGLTPKRANGTWKWVDDTLLTQSFWSPGEPNGFGGRDEDCVETRFLERENSWNDIPCTDQNFWICEKMIDL